MGDVNKGGRKLVVELGYLGAHLYAELCVEVGERFVEEEYLRLADDCASQSDTLTLTAGKSFRFTRKKRSDAEDCRGFFYSVVDFLRSHLSESETERHVLVDGHVRIKRVVLENHRDVSIPRLDVVYETSVDIELAGGNFFETGYHTQSRGFTAAGRSDENDKFLVVDFKVKVTDRLDVTGVNLVNVPERQTCHNFLLIKSVVCTDIVLHRSIKYQ